MMTSTVQKYLHWGSSKFWKILALQKSPFLDPSTTSTSSPCPSSHGGSRTSPNPNIAHLSFDQQWLPFTRVLRGFGQFPVDIRLTPNSRNRDQDQGQNPNEEEPSLTFDPTTTYPLDFNISPSYGNGGFSQGAPMTSMETMTRPRPPPAYPSSSSYNFDFNYFGWSYGYNLLIGLFRLIFWIQFVSYLKYESSTFKIAVEEILPTPVGVNYSNLTSGGVLGGSHSGRIEYWAGSVYTYSIPFINSLEWLSVLLTSKMFVHFLNTWLDFEGLFWRTLSIPSNHPKVKTLQLNVKTVLFVTIVPTLTFEVFFLFYHLRKTVQGLSCYVLCCIIVKDLVLQIVSLVEDCKVTLMFRTTALGFRKVRFGINDFIRKSEETLGFGRCSTDPPRKCFRKWLRVLQVVRDQTALIGRSQAAHEIFFFTYMTVLMTFLIFSTLSPLSRGQEPMVMVKLVERLGQLFLGMSRLYIKAHYSNQISSEEALIVKDLINWDISHFDLDRKFEVKHMIDTLTANPSKIIYANLFSPDKKLMLSIGSQLVAYIIVLMQFQNSGNACG